MDFPGGPVVKTSSSKVRVASLIPDQGAKIPHASWLKGQTKTKQRNRNNIVTNSVKIFFLFKWSTSEKKRKTLQKKKKDCNDENVRHVATWRKSVAGR